MKLFRSMNCLSKSLNTIKSINGPCLYRNISSRFKLKHMSSSELAQICKEIEYNPHHKTILIDQLPKLNKESLKSINPGCMVLLLGNLNRNYNLNNENITNTLKYIEEWLIERLNTDKHINYKIFLEIIAAILDICQKHQRYWNCEALELALINQSRKVNNPLACSHYMYTITKIIALSNNFARYEDSFEVISKKITSNNIEKSSLPDLIYILKYFSTLKLNLNREFYTQEGTDVFLAIENRLGKFPILNGNFITDIISSFLVCNKGSSEFLDSLVKNLFSNLHEIKDESLQNLSYILRTTLFSDFHKQLNLCMKPFYENLLVRIDSHIKPEHLSFILSQISPNMVYTDERFLEKIKRYLKDQRYLNNNLSVKLTLNTWLLRYLYECYDELDVKLVQNLLGTENRSASTYQGWFQAYFLSITDYQIPRFWIEFVKELQILKKDEQTLIHLHNIKLHLQFKPGMTHIWQYLNNALQDFESEFKRNMLTIENDKRARFDSFKVLYQIEQILLEKNAKYQKDYFENIFMDFAVDNCKAFVITYPNEYVFPKIRQKTIDRSNKTAIEKLGWKVVMIPYFTLESSEIEQLILNSLD